MEKIVEKNRLLNARNLSLKYGIYAGIAMSVFLLLFQLAGVDYAPGYKFFMYGFLFIAITAALYQIAKVSKGKIFAKGVLTGLQLTVITAFLMVVVNLVVYFVAPQYTFSRFGLEPTTIFEVLEVCAMMFIEVFVAGNLMAFINMQYFKRNLH